MIPPLTDAGVAVVKVSNADNADVIGRVAILDSAPGVIPPNLSAQITGTLPDDGVYLILATPFVVGRSGPHQLTLVETGEAPAASPRTWRVPQSWLNANRASVC